MGKDDQEHDDTLGHAPYVTPEIAWEDELGTRPGLVAACAKQPLQTDACNADPGPS